MKKLILFLVFILSLSIYLLGGKPVQAENIRYELENSAINNYKKESGLTGDLRVDQFSGAASYVLNLEIPQGRNNFQPSLNLFYNSHDRSFDSWVGQGWSFDLGYVIRSTRKGVNNLYIGDEFTLFLNGKSYDLALIDANENLYGAKIEGDYLHIQFDEANNWWLVIDTLGTKYHFGQTASSRQDSGELVYKWMLDKVIDTNDNFYALEYFKRLGQIYPQHVYYTGHGQEDGPMEIIFNLEARTDLIASYQSQFLVTTDRRLGNIEIQVDGQLKFKYEFSYSVGQNGRTSLLASVAKKGYQDEQEYVLPATTFTYQQQEVGWEDYSDTWGHVSPFKPEDDEPAQLLFDVNGDSWVDRQTSFHNGFGWEAGNWAFPNNINWENVEIVDINGDKYPDLIVEFPALNNEKRVLINNRVDGFSFSNSWTNSLPDLNTNIYQASYGGNSRISFADVNGDGLNDLIYSFTYNGQIQRRGIHLNTGDGFQGGYGDFPTPLAGCGGGLFPIRCQSYGVQLVDINGDSLVDVLRLGLVYLNLGNGFEQEPNQQWDARNLEGVNRNHNFFEWGGARLTDINSDGMTDIVVAGRYYDGQFHDTFHTFINNGSGWQNNDNWNLPIVMAGNEVDINVRLMDINNDGLMDVVKGDDHESEVYIGTQNVSNLLTEIHNGYGAETLIEYQASGRYFDADNNFENPSLPINLQTVKRIATNDGLNNETATSYKYKDGIFYHDQAFFYDNVDYTLNQFAGFGLVESLTDDQLVKTYYHQGGGVDNYDLGEYEDNIYKKGRIFREEVLQQSGQDLILLSHKINRWTGEDLGDGRHFVSLENSVSYDYQGGGMVMENFQEEGAGLGVMEEDGFVEQNQINQSLAELTQAQAFEPDYQNQLVSQTLDGLVKTYYLGRDQLNNHIYRMEVRPPQGELDEEEEEGAETGDGEMMYFRNQGCIWEGAVNGIVASEYINGNRGEVTNSFNGGACQLSRLFLPFDTSELPDDAIILNASLFIKTFFVNAAGQIYLVEMSTNVPTMGEDRYRAVLDVSGSDLWVESPNSWYEFEFNEDALSWIDLESYTILALRGRADLFNQPGSIVTSYKMSETGEEGPYLTIEYTLNHAPEIPEDLEVEEQTNPDDVADQTPELTAIYNDYNEEDEAIAYQIQVIQAGGDYEQPLWDSGQQELNTPISHGQRIEEISYGGNDLPLEGYQYFWRIKFWDNGDELNSEGLWSDGSDYFYMDGSAAPRAPEGLLTENRPNPIDLIDLTPSFSAVYYDPNPIDSARWYQLQVDNNEDFSSPVWDSRKTELDNLVDNGARSPEIVYRGARLTYNGSTYHWRIRFWDDEGEEGIQGAWSAIGHFTLFNQANTLGNADARAIKYHYDAATGNLIEEEGLGKVRAANNGIFIDSRGDEKTSSYQYAEAVEEDLHILSAPKSKILMDMATRAITTVELFYDSLEFGRVEKANVTKEDLKMNAIQYKKEFNNFGLVTATKDPLGNRTTVDYDPSHYYPSETVNGLNQSVTTEYDLAFGKPIRRIDPNGVVEEWDYDSFGRLTDYRKTRPENNNLNMVTMQTMEYHDTDSPSWVKKVDLPNQSLEQESYTYFDGLGRQIQTREQSEREGYFRVVSIGYDAKGNVYRQTLPYFDEGSAYVEESWETPYNRYAYDAKNRVVEENVVAGDNTYTTLYDYDGWNVLVTDANGNVKKLYKDAYGQLVQVDEYLNNQVLSTRYEYNLLGKLTRITDSQNNQRKFKYDKLGRLLEQEEMHNRNALDYGVWEYEYDDASNLVSKTDPNGNTVNYTYDSLNRLLTEDFEGDEGVEVRYLYDFGQNGIGRLSRVIKPEVDASFNYDKWGRLTRENKWLNINNRHNFQTFWTYGLASAPLEIRYPEGFQVKYDYNSNLLIKKLQINDQNQGWQDVVDSLSYSDLKQISQINYTNGVVVENEYDPGQAYRLTGKTTVNGQDQTLQNLEYVYDNVGNITQVTDGSPTLLAKTTYYDYDDLYRLTRAEVRNSANEENYVRTYAYDGIGNLINKSDIQGFYFYQNPNPYQATRIGLTNYSYDANGNLVDDSAKTFEYDYNDRLTSVAIDDNNVLSHSYDHTGQRVYKELTSSENQETEHTSTYYPSQYFERQVFYIEDDPESSSTTTIRHIFLGNQMIANLTKKDQEDWNTSYILSDHLGSSSVILDSSGVIQTLYDYYPFGGTRLEHTEGEMEMAGMHTDYRYTGQEQDEETGLYYYGARYYMAGEGRFTQGDPIVLNVIEAILLDPQLLNAYAYSGNNPIVYSDPSGQMKFNWSYMKNTAAGLWNRAKDFASGAWNTINYLTNNNLYQVGLDAHQMSYSLGSQLAGDVQWLVDSYAVDPKATTAMISESLSKVYEGWQSLSDGQKAQAEGYALGVVGEAYLGIKGGYAISGQKAIDTAAQIRNAPDEAFATLRAIEGKGYKATLEGYKGGSIWKNDNNILPTKSDSYYKEWDIYPNVQGAERGAERIVTGEGGEAWYTRNHYETFIRIK